MLRFWHTSGFWGSGSSPGKSYSKDLREGVIRVIFRPQAANRSFFGYLLREIFACNDIGLCRAGLTSHISRNKPGV